MEYVAAKSASFSSAGCLRSTQECKVRKYWGGEEYANRDSDNRVPTCCDGPFQIAYNRFFLGDYCSIQGEGARVSF
jgi:hypothetical protein